MTGAIRTPGSQERVVSKSRSGNSWDTGAPTVSSPAGSFLPICSAANRIARISASGCWEIRLLRWLGPPHSVIQTGFALSPCRAITCRNFAMLRAWKGLEAGPLP